MRGWIILAAVLLFLFLLTLIRVGADVTYGEAGLQIRVRLGAIRLTLFPRRPKKPKKARKSSPKPETEPKPPPAGEKPQPSGGKPSSPKQTEAEQTPAEEKNREKQESSPSETAKEDLSQDTSEQKEKPEEQQTARRGGLPIPLMDLISLGLNAAGRTLARLQIDNLALEYLIGGKSDPAMAAIIYGSVYAGGGAIVPLLENTFYRIKNREIQAWIDFDSDQSLVWMQLALSIRIGQALSIGIGVLRQFLTAYLRQRKEKKKAGRNHNGTEASDQ